MNRLPDKRKENGKHGERASKCDNLVHLVAGSSDLGRGSRLQALTPSKSNRLPPLKSQRLPDIQSRHASENVPSLPSAKADFNRFSVGPAQRTEGISKNSAALKPYRLSDNEKASNNKKSNAKDIHKTQDTFNVKLNDNKRADEIKPHPPPALKDPRTSLKPSYPVKRYGEDQDVPWQKERELLRKHRRQQVERLNVPKKPVKATMVFDSFEKETKKPNQESEKSGKKSSITERKKIDLSVARKCDDEEDWDWDKDIEEYMKIEEKERTSQHTTSGIISPVQYGGQREKTPVILNCTKKGVGFKSRKRIEDERRQEQERIEKERKEKERIEQIIPQKIRKDLKKYGFR